MAIKQAEGKRLMYKDSIMAKKKPKQKKQAPGPKPDVLKLDGDWKESIKKSLSKKKPVDGWPKK